MKREVGKAILRYVVIPILGAAALAGGILLLDRYPSLQPFLVVAMVLCAGIMLWVNRGEERQPGYVVLAMGILLVAIAQIVRMSNIESETAFVLSVLGSVSMLVGAICTMRRRLRHEGKEISTG